MTTKSVRPDSRSFMPMPIPEKPVPTMRMSVVITFQILSVSEYDARVSRATEVRRARSECDGRQREGHPGRAPGADPGAADRGRPRDVPGRRLCRDVARQGRGPGGILQGRGLLQLRRQGR